MKLLTEKEISDKPSECIKDLYPELFTVDHSRYTPCRVMDVPDLIDLVAVAIKEAQQDLLASASEGFEEFYHKALGFRKTINCTDRTRKSRSLKVWQAAKLSDAKEIESLNERIKKLEFMIENGLGWEDMKSDGAQGEGVRNL